jgi:hypothetical protein
MPDLQSELDRCDQEIAQLQNTHGDRAYGIAMAVQDWEREKRLILTELCPTSARSAGTSTGRGSNLSITNSKGDVK